MTSARSKGLKYTNDSERLRRQAMAGWAVPGVEVRVVDAAMKDVPRDMQSIGEVVAMGDHIMAGYYKEPEATAAVMTGPWFHSGDMAVWDTEGYIHIVEPEEGNHHFGWREHLVARGGKGDLLACRCV